MQTLKTTVVVILLLVVFYGVYEVLNRPPDEPPAEVAWIDEQGVSPPDIEFGTAMEDPTSEPLVSVPSDAMMQDEASPVPQLPSRFSEAEDSAAADQTAGLSFEPPSQPQVAMPGSVPHAMAPPPAADDSKRTPPSNDLADGNPNRSAPASSVYSGDGQIQHNQFYDESLAASSDERQATGPRIGAKAFERARRLAKSQIEQGQYHDALFELSVFYQSPDLTEQEHGELLDLLDPLAGKVIYSREHLVLPAYEVRRNETLMDIAAQYNVPWQLLQKINGIEKPRVLLPTSEIKVVPGPFRAEVDLQAGQLTLFLGQLYAGRFPVSVGAESQLSGGEFSVRDKREDRDYFAPNGHMIPASSPDNPFGQAWLDLGGELSIHGSPLAADGEARGCIGLSPRDASDVYGILSVGSRVRIVR